MRTRVWMPFLAAGPILAAGSLLLPLHLQRHVMGSIAVIASVTIAVAVRVARPAPARAWYLIAAGIGSAGIGFWAQAHGEHDPVGNVCWLATGACLVAGLASLVRERSIGARGSALADALILATAAALLNWLFAFQPLVASHFSGGFKDVGYVVNPGLDTVVFAAVGALLFGPASLDGRVPAALGRRSRRCSSRTGSRGMGSSAWARRTSAPPTACGSSASRSRPRRRSIRRSACARRAIGGEAT